MSNNHNNPRQSSATNPSSVAITPNQRQQYLYSTTSNVNPPGYPQNTFLMGTVSNSMPNHANFNPNGMNFMSQMSVTNMPVFQNSQMNNQMQYQNFGGNLSGMDPYKINNLTKNTYIPVLYSNNLLGHSQASAINRTPYGSPEMPMILVNGMLRHPNSMYVHYQGAQNIPIQAHVMSSALNNSRVSGHRNNPNTSSVNNDPTKHVSQSKTKAVAKETETSNNPHKLDEAMLFNILHDEVDKDDDTNGSTDDESDISTVCDDESPVENSSTRTLDLPTSYNKLNKSGDLIDFETEVSLFGQNTDSVLNQPVSECEHNSALSLFFDREAKKMEGNKENTNPLEEQLATNKPEKYGSVDSSESMDDVENLKSLHNLIAWSSGTDSENEKESKKLDSSIHFGACNSLYPILLPLDCSGNIVTLSRKMKLSEETDHINKKRVLAVDLKGMENFKNLQKISGMEMKPPVPPQFSHNVPSSMSPPGSAFSAHNPKAPPSYPYLVQKSAANKLVFINGEYYAVPNLDERNVPDQSPNGGMPFSMMNQHNLARSSNARSSNNTRNINANLTSKADKSNSISSENQLKCSEPFQYTSWSQRPARGKNSQKTVALMELDIMGYESEEHDDLNDDKTDLPYGLTFNSVVRLQRPLGIRMGSSVEAVRREQMEVMSVFQNTMELLMTKRPNRSKQALLNVMKSDRPDMVENKTDAEKETDLLNEEVDKQDSILMANMVERSESTSKETSEQTRPYMPSMEFFSSVLYSDSLTSNECGKEQEGVEREIENNKNDPERNESTNSEISKTTSSARNDDGVRNNEGNEAKADSVKDEDDNSYESKKLGQKRDVTVNSETSRTTSLASKDDSVENEEKNEAKSNSAEDEATTSVRNTLLKFSMSESDEDVQKQGPTSQSANMTKNFVEYEAFDLRGSKEFQLDNICDVENSQSTSESTSENDISEPLLMPDNPRRTSEQWSTFEQRRSDVAMLATRYAPSEHCSLVLGKELHTNLSQLVSTFEKEDGIPMAEFERMKREEKTAPPTTECKVKASPDTESSQEVSVNQVDDPVTAKNKKKKEEKKKYRARKIKNKSNIQFDPHYEFSVVQKGLENGKLIKDRLHVNMKNYREAYIKDPNSGRDIFIYEIKDRNRAFDGDEVVVELYPPDTWKEFPDKSIQKRGKVVYILKKNHPRTALGVLKVVVELNQKFIILSPRDYRIPRIKLDLAECPKDLIQKFANYKDRVFHARIDDWSEINFAHGTIIESLGILGEIETETKCILLDNNLDVDPFPDADKYIPQSPYTIPDEEFNLRKDLRNECIFSIDPDGAKDLDDALSATVLPNGNFLIGVHISDVAHFIEPNTPFDQFICERATSVYVTQRAYHMLPYELCKLCSLTPNEDKLSFSVFIEMDEKGTVINKEFRKTIMRSCAQLTYAHAQDVIENGSFTKLDELPEIVNGYTRKDCEKTILMLYSLSKKMRKRRFDGGALKIDRPKITFRIDPQTKLPTNYSLYITKESNWLVEEFMLLANMLVAKHIKDKYPGLALLRRHSEPSANQLKSTAETLAMSGVKLDCGSSGSLYQSVMRYDQDGEDNQRRMIGIHHALIKTMVKALYFSSGECDPDDVTQYWHYALNVPYYTHFTSPIRRYMDIIVHRMLASSLGYGKMPNWTSEDIQGMAEISNQKKYDAKRASESSDDLYFRLYVQQHGPLMARGIVTDVRDRYFEVIEEKGRTVYRFTEDSVLKSKHVKAVQIQNNYNYVTWTVQWRNDRILQICQFTTLKLELSYSVEKHKVICDLVIADK